MKTRAQVGRTCNWAAHQRELQDKPLRSKVNVEFNGKGWGLTEEEMRDFGAELRHSLHSLRFGWN